MWQLVGTRIGQMICHKKSENPVQKRTESGSMTLISGVYQRRSFSPLLFVFFQENKESTSIRPLRRVDEKERKMNHKNEKPPAKWTQVNLSRHLEDMCRTVDVWNGGKWRTQQRRELHPRCIWWRRSGVDCRAAEDAVISPAPTEPQPADGPQTDLCTQLREEKSQRLFM